MRLGLCSIPVLALVLVSCAAGQPTSINGWVWHDLCDSGQDGEAPPPSPPDGCLPEASAIGPYRADGIRQPEEPLLAGVVVRLGDGACPSFGRAEAVTAAADVSYSFAALQPGTYCVSIDPQTESNLALLRPGIWTFPEVSENVVMTTVTVQAGENRFEVDFGWDHLFLP
jgi:hypothetical protein